MQRKMILVYLMLLKLGFNKVVGGLEKGAINMISVAIAIATAGIIVGAVASTGLSKQLNSYCRSYIWWKYNNFISTYCFALYY